VSNEDEYAKLVKNIAGNIRGQRKKCGFTQAQMIDFGFDIKNYQKLEYGKHQFSLHTVFRLSRAFGCPIEALVNEPKRKKPSKR
jgi:DNA-binding XRE family transcriptional regulator